MAVNHRGSLRLALDSLIVDGEVHAPVRPEITASWQRSIASHLQRDRLDVPFEPGPHDDRLEWVARPVIDRLADDLEPDAMSVLLCDGDGIVLQRAVRDRSLRARLDRVMLAPGFSYAEDRVGTNGIGTALALRSAATVEGNEHFADPLTTLACAASPIVDPFTSALLGVVDLTCTTAQSQSLMLAMARNAAWNIAERMVSAASISDRVLLEQFLRARRTSRGPLVAITPQQMLTNAAAAPLFGPEDRAWLWEWTQRGLTADGGQPRELDVGSSTLTAFCEPVRSGHEIIGALVRVTRRSAGEGDGMAVGSNRAVTSRPVAGWSSLRESELGVAELVAQGLSNREVAARLYVSPHTVDFHLRQIFRKLSIRSRVELARLVVDHADGHGGDLA